MSLRALVTCCGLALFASVTIWCPASAARAYTQRFTRGGLPVRWVAATIPMRVDPELLAHREESTAAATAGFAAWRGMRGVPTLALRGETERSPGFNPGGANENGVYRVARLPVAGAALAVTVSTYRESDGEILDADVLIDASVDLALLDEAPRGRDRRRYDLASLIAHESGHVLGLGETSDDELATMWPHLYRGNTTARTLAPDDEAGVLEIYARPGVLTSASCGVSKVARGGGANLALSIALGAFGLAAVARRRRRLLAAAALLMFVMLGSGGRAAHADDATHGRAQILDVRWDRGLLVTELLVTTPAGQEHLVIPGGTRDGIVQQIGDALPPADGAEVSLGAVTADGARAWVAFDDAETSALRTTRVYPIASVH